MLNVALALLCSARDMPYALLPQCDCTMYFLYPLPEACHNLYTVTFFCVSKRAMLKLYTVLLQDFLCVF